jgi:hypothetical protein
LVLDFSELLLSLVFLLSQLILIKELLVLNLEGHFTLLIASFIQETFQISYLFDILLFGCGKVSLHKGTLLIEAHLAL